MHPAHIIFQHFPRISTKQKEQYKSLQNLYIDWNSKVNVISRKDIDHLYIHHVLHSLVVGKIVEFKEGTTILDVGTGGGFPGIPLAILFPEVKFHLVDSIGKKIRVVKDIARELKLSNVEISQSRIENVKGHYDFIVSRAVSRMKTVYNWVESKVSGYSFNTIANGIIFLKGGDVSEEIEELGIHHSIFEISDYFVADYFKTKKVIHIPFT